MPSPSRFGSDADLPAPAVAARFGDAADASAANASIPGPSDAVRNTVRTVVSPVVNMLDYPIRATAADVVGLAKGGIPLDAASRKAFSAEREASLAQTALPETDVAKKIEGGIGTVLHQAGRYTPPQLAVRALGLEDAAAPYQTMIGDVLGLAGFSRGGSSAIRAGTQEVTQRTSERVAAALAKDSPAEIEKIIGDIYDRAIRPTFVGKGNATKIDEAEKNVISGLTSVIRNKQRLVLADRKGKEVAGRTPETLDEFIQAIAQTKRPVFDKYDGLTQQADSLGIRIDALPIAAELRKFVADQSFALPRFKGMREYAEQTAESLEMQGNVLPSVAQNTVRNLNEGLTAFYRASSPKAASEAAIDDLVANQYRGRVDAALEKAGLPGWQEARNEYGALKAIEGEVAHRAVVYGRQDPGGGLFGRLGSIATYEELARFATSFDPHALVTAAAIRGGTSLKQYMSGPNRAVRRMFRKTEELMDRAPGAAGPEAPHTGGLQPPRPTGPNYEMYGGSEVPTIRGGSATEAMGLAPRRPAEPDPFLTPPGGGRTY